MLKVVLCEDEAPTIEDYCERITKIAERHHIAMTVECYQSAKEMLFSIESYQKNVDLILLDIQLPDMNGLKAAQKLRASGCTAKIIFLTAYPEYVFSCFDVNPFYYLIKNDTTPEKFEEVLLKAVEQCQNENKQTYLIHTKEMVVRIPIKEIIYAEVLNHQIIIHSTQSSYTYSGVFQTACQELEPYRFLRISRCYLINLEFFKCMQKNVIHLYTGPELPIGRYYQKKVIASLKQTFFDMNATLADKQHQTTEPPGNNAPLKKIP